MIEMDQAWRFTECLIFVAGPDAFVVGTASVEILMNDSDIVPLRYRTRSKWSGTDVLSG